MHLNVNLSIPIPFYIIFYFKCKIYLDFMYDEVLKITHTKENERNRETNEVNRTFSLK